MMVQSAAASPLNPRPTGRWWEYVKRGDVHCGPRPFGHHIRNMFHVNESGFIRCEKKVPNMARHLVELEALVSRGLSREAEQYRIALRAQNIDLPNNEEIKALGRTAGYVPCDRWVFLYAIRGGGIVVAEVSPDEKDQMEDLSTPTEMIDYLGVLNTNR
jgi:hypothetical protein